MYTRTHTHTYIYVGMSIRQMISLDHAASLYICKYIILYIHIYIYKFLWWIDKHTCMYMHKQCISYYFQPI